MAEYIEREELIARLQKVCVTDDTFGMGIQFGTENAINCIKEAPASDVVEVVRCKDCQHARQTVYGNYHCLVDHRLAHEETDYCGYGEKKEGVEK